MFDHKLFLQNEQYFNDCCNIYSVNMLKGFFQDHSSYKCLVLLDDLHNMNTVRIQKLQEILGKEKFDDVIAFMDIEIIPFNNTNQHFINFLCEYKCFGKYAIDMYLEHYTLRQKESFMQTYGLQYH